MLQCHVCVNISQQVNMSGSVLVPVTIYSTVRKTTKSLVSTETSNATCTAYLENLVTNLNHVILLLLV